MIDYLDAGTFVMRPIDVPGGSVSRPRFTPGETAWFADRHPLLNLDAPSDEETGVAFDQAFAQARSAVFGLRVLLDGSCLGPKEMGTQVTFMALAEALAAHPDIASLGIALAAPIPAYAADTLSNPKIDARPVPGGDLSAFFPVDVVHRPFQVTPGTDVASWRHIGRRTVVTVHDLIAYQVPDYHESRDTWNAYRMTLRHAVATVDGVVVISDDVRRQVELERLGADEHQLYVVPDGVGHLAGDEPERVPDELEARGHTHIPFALVLGANYSHKNRDLAIRVVDELQRRGHGLALVLAGAYVPFGSSRPAEAAIQPPGLNVYVVPDVSSAERNWLLRHAELVLYTTSAEGFGLVPHEAAAFGTPTVFVPFGPFAERFAGLPVAPADWSVDEFASAAEALLLDPALARTQVEAIVAETSRYDWSATAASMVEIYRAVLAKPARA